MKVFMDTNIFVDVLAKRNGWFSSLKILDLVEKKQIIGYYSVMTIPIIWYLQKDPEARQKIRDIVEKCQAISFTSQMTKQVLDKKIFGDLEDELQYLSAKKVNCQYLISRNISDFKKIKDIKVVPPEDFLAIFGKIKS